MPFLQGLLITGLLWRYREANGACSELGYQTKECFKNISTVAVYMEPESTCRRRASLVQAKVCFGSASMQCYEEMGYADVESWVPTSSQIAEALDKYCTGIASPDFETACHLKNWASYMRCTQAAAKNTSGSSVMGIICGITTQEFNMPCIEETYANCSQTTRNVVYNYRVSIAPPVCVLRLGHVNCVDKAGLRAKASTCYLTRLAINAFTGMEMICSRKDYIEEHKKAMPCVYTYSQICYKSPGKPSDRLQKMISGVDYICEHKDVVPCYQRYFQEYQQCVVTSLAQSEDKELMTETDLCKLELSSQNACVLAKYSQCSSEKAYFLSNFFKNYHLPSLCAGNLTYSQSSNVGINQLSPVLLVAAVVASSYWFLRGL